jgi:hypothetical protein
MVVLAMFVSLVYRKCTNFHNTGVYSSYFQEGRILALAKSFSVTNISNKLEQLTSCSVARLELHLQVVQSFGKSATLNALDTSLPLPYIAAEFKVQKYKIIVFTLYMCW